jgi:O-antigen/teichoic acid export membrane protein
MLKKYLLAIRQNNQRITRLSREGCWILVGQVLNISGALVLVRVLTEHLEPTEYGYFMLALTAASLINQTVMGGISNGITRYYLIAVEKGDLKNYIISAKLLIEYSILTTAAIYLITVLGLGQMNLSEWIPIFSLITIFAIVSGIVSIITNVQNAARQRVISSMHTGADAWLKICILIAIFPVMQGFGFFVVMRKCS